ncbi:hypothetical protein O7599_04050 [Streptomyces sp. WMMC500]|uniref:hypothetical protein n=1 Tax=Streptomyces sp. WMMC500 TaxID=3015154 RepID=UPI00248CEF6E|nr:hypothetical protein [Streptomyces sp. WMMC500]WBB61734.1 hypothetical protein O7599_04050 [Streptomyces sp. WMMC500]
MASTQDKLREQAETVRGRLGEAAGELAAKADLKQRTRKTAADVKRVVDDKTPEGVRHAAGRAGHAAGRAARTGKKRPVPTATVFGGVGLALLLLVFRRARTRVRGH